MAVASGIVPKGSQRRGKFLFNQWHLNSILTQVMIFGDEMEKSPSKNSLLAAGRLSSALI